MPEPNAPRDDARQQAIREALAELRAEYAEGLPGVIAELEAAAHKANVSVSEVDFRHLQTLAHRMHGAAGSYGFRAVSEAAARLEELLVARDQASVEDRAASAGPIQQALADVGATAQRELAEFLETKPAE